MKELAEWAKLIMEEMRRFDQNHRDILHSLEKIKDEQVEQGKVLVKNTASLDEHIRRTNILEEEVKSLDEKITNGSSIPWKKIAIIVSIISGIMGIIYKINI